MLDPFSTITVSAALAADPERVWEGLTSATASEILVPGVTLRSDWTPGSPVLVETGGFVVFGEVLHSAPPRRVSLTLGAPAIDASNPTTIVTWELRHLSIGGTVLTLTVDDLMPAADDGDFEESWLEVFRGVVARLRASAHDVALPGDQVV